MSDHGILMSAPMVRQLLARRKHVTRRMSKQWLRVKAGDTLWVRETYGIGGARLVDPCLNYRADESQRPLHKANEGLAWYPVGGYAVSSDSLLKIREGWIPSIHMPRWASRITLIATEDARQEPLHDITEEDAIAEGAMFHDGRPVGHHGWRHDYHDVFPTARHSFAHLWDSLHGKKDPWASNPTVVRLAFDYAEAK